MSIQGTSDLFSTALLALDRAHTRAAQAGAEVAAGNFDAVMDLRSAELQQSAGIAVLKVAMESSRAVLDLLA